MGHWKLAEKRRKWMMKDYRYKIKMTEDTDIYSANKIVSASRVCKYCGKPAELLCDMPKQVQVCTLKQDYVTTCDAALCHDCAVKFRAFDFCPECVEELLISWESKIQSNNLGDIDQEDN